MNGHAASACARRALLVALIAGASSCGDDDEGARPGRDAGAAARGGSDGRGGSGVDGGAGRDAGGEDVTRAQCMREAVQSAGPRCLACVCAIEPGEVVGCKEACWALVTCVHGECGGDGQDSECIGRECAGHLGGVVQANTFGPVFGECVQACVDDPRDVDGGR